MGKLMVGEFQGPKETVQNRPPPHPFPGPSAGCGKSAVSGPEVPVEILKKRMEDAEDADEAAEAKEMYNTLQKNREFMRSVVKTVVNSVIADDGLTDAVFTDNVELTKYEYLIILDFILSFVHFTYLLLILGMTVTMLQLMSSMTNASMLARMIMLSGCLTHLSTCVREDLMRKSSKPPSIPIATIPICMEFISFNFHICTKIR